MIFPVAIYLFKVNIKNTRKRCESSPKLTNKLPEKGCLQDSSDSDIHSSFPLWGKDFSGSDADIDAEC